MMDEGFDIPVDYKGEKLLFPARLLQLGYTHKFEVTIDDTVVFFERDDSGNYRALSDPETFDAKHPPDINLLKAIAEAIENILK